MKRVDAWECEICGHVTPRTEEGARQHEEICRWTKAGHAVWVTSGVIHHAPRSRQRCLGRTST